VASVYRLCKAAAEKSPAPSDIVLVNIGPTRIDPLISLKIEAQCGQVLKSLCSHLGVPVGDNNAAIIEK